MNNQKKDILNKLFMEPYVNQRVLSEMTGHSHGIVNRSISQLLKEGFINEEMHPTLKAKEYFERHKTQNAIILAAGFGISHFGLYYLYSSTNRIRHFFDIYFYGNIKVWRYSAGGAG